MVNNMTTLQIYALEKLTNLIDRQSKEARDLLEHDISKYAMGQKLAKDKLELVEELISIHKDLVKPFEEK